MIIWNWHNDEYERLHFFTGGKNFVGDFPPYGDLVAMPDGWWLNKIDNKDKIILYPCVKDTSQLTAMGFKYAFTKDSHHKWNGESIVLPPVFKHHEAKPKTQTACSVIHYYKERDRKNHDMIAPIGYPIYGFGHEVNYDIDGTLAQTKFLIHFKEIGYLCNAVIKAMAHGTIPIMSAATFTYGYADYLTPGKTCIIAETKDQIQDAVNMPESKRKEMADNLLDKVEQIKSTYYEVKHKTELWLNGLN